MNVRADPPVGSLPSLATVAGDPDSASALVTSVPSLLKSFTVAVLAAPVTDQPVPAIVTAAGDPATTFVGFSVIAGEDITVSALLAV